MIDENTKKDLGTEHGMLPAIFLDFHGTTSNFTFWQSLDSEKHRKIQEKVFEANAPLIKPWMRGQIKWQSVVLDISALSGVPVEALVCEAGNKSVPLMEPEMESAVESLRTCTRVFLVSDNMDLLTERFFDENLDAAFDDVWFSCQHGELKNEPNATAYEMLAKKHNVDLSRSVLFDDSWSSIRTFTRLGGTGIKVQGPEDTLEYLGMRNVGFVQTPQENESPQQLLRA